MTALHMANREQRLIAHIARTHGISYEDLSDAIHAHKESVGRGGGDNLTPDEIKQIAKEVADHIGGTE
jgi:hypothetical protein